MIPADTGSAYGAQESLRIGAYAAQSPSWRGKGGKGEETGAATNPLQQTGVTRREHQLDTAIATAMAAAAKTAQASNGIAVKTAELTRPCSTQESRTAC